MVQYNRKQSTGPQAGTAKARQVFRASRMAQHGLSVQEDSRVRQRRAGGVRDSHAGLWRPKPLVKWFGCWVAFPDGSMEAVSL